MFEEYASFYDLIYENKQYSNEVEYVIKIIRKYRPDAKSILDLGCGTGKHAILLAKEDYQVTGIDSSEKMLEQAKLKRSKLDKNIKKNLNFNLSNITKLKLNSRFDVICSLFHVISYQVNNHDILSTMETVKNHLVKGGIFIFDVWYGPGVLTSRPEYRKTIFKDETSAITKIANPEIYTEKNTVKVNYTLLINDSEKEINEVHYMRYFYIPEIEMLLDLHGIKILGVFDGYSNKEVSADTWSATFIAIKQI